MQTFDENDQLFQTDVGHLKDLLGEMTEIQEEHREKNLYHVIGKLPNKHQIIQVNGLQYKVTFVDKALGRFHAKIQRTEDMK